MSFPVFEPGPDIPSILLWNGRIIDPVNNVDQIGSLLIENGMIAGISENPDHTPAGAEIIDVSGKWIMPGLIDMHVHLREPGEEYKETIESGTKAAASGGFTAVACMPNTTPVNDSEAVTEFILDKARNARAKVYPVAAISVGSKGNAFADYGELKSAGAVAVSDDGRPVLESLLMRRALEYCGNFGLLLISHSEDSSLSRGGHMNEGLVSSKLGLRGIPHTAEEVMVYRDISLAEYTRRPIHIAHVSTKESVALIRRAKKRGCPVTAETAPHYFSLTEEAIERYNTNAKMNPPLRTSVDIEAIRTGLRDGTIDAIATDHAPHSILEKDIEFEYAAFGIIGLETSVPLTLNLWRDGVIDENMIARLLSVNPARILGVTGGSLGKGENADVTVIDPELEFTYTKDTILSKSKNTPFLDWKMKGKAFLTMVDGRITYQADH